MTAAVADSATRLRITEIFHSLQGEARTVGLPTVFVRLTGCPLRCVYCDTAYAFTGGELRDLDAVLDEVAGYGARYVTVTGGEPLAQPACLPLLAALCDAGYEVSLETSGALPVGAVDPRVVKVLDLKTPASGEVDRNDYRNIAHLTREDQVKFVLCDRADYEWARFKVDEYRLAERAGDVLFSPSHGQQAPRELAEWILADRLPVRLQLQLHKLLWNDEPRALMVPRAVVLTSGGLDSTTVLAMARAEGYRCHTLSFDYGQRHRAELHAAARLSAAAGDVEHKVVSLNLDSIGGSALTDAAIAVPEEATEGIPVTYVPARNTVFLAIALGWAEVLDARDIFIGVNAVDYSGYPDCRPVFIDAFERLANVATRTGVEGGGIRVRAPLIDLGKDAIIRRGIELGVDYSLTVSCYQATDQGLACGRCDACRLRRDGFAAAGIDDPTRYRLD